MSPAADKVSLSLDNKCNQSRISAFFRKSETMNPVLSVNYYFFLSPHELLQHFRFQKRALPARSTRRLQNRTLPFSLRCFHSFPAQYIRTRVHSKLLLLFQITPIHSSVCAVIPAALS